MDDTLRVINELEAEKVVGRYAIGGAIGFLFYIEPTATDDLDIFCYLQPSEGLIDQGIVPIYQWLAKKGFMPKNEHVVIAGIPVQFLAPTDKLDAEALEQAVEDKYLDVPTRVFQYEHLLAIAARLSRPKDKVRIAIALESRKPDEGKLKEILVRHNLLDKWSKITA